MTLAVPPAPVKPPARFQPATSTARQSDPPQPAASVAGPRSSAPAAFDSADDLYALAFMASSSSDVSVLVQGFMASMTCIEVRPERGRLDALAGVAQVDRVASEQARTARLLLHRCRGFFDNDPVGNAQWRATIADRLRSAGVFVAGLSHRTMTEADIRGVIDRADAMAFELGGVDIIDRTLRRQGIAPDSQAANAFAVAYLLAACDVGRDCSGSSIRYAQLCALNSRCPGSIEALYREGMPAELAPKVGFYREVIADAFRARNHAFFGAD